jgi:hypothetical protein
MLRRFVVLVAFLGAGCHGFLKRDAEICAPAGCPIAAPEAAICCPPQPPCAPPPCPPPPPKQAAPPEKAPPEKAPPEQVEHVNQQAQIAQEVMLVPRTVYVPYVAQTPVTPVRLSAVNTIPGRVNSIVERRDLETQPTPPAAPSRQEEMPPAERQQLLDMCKQLADQLSRLEQAQRRAAQAVPCPPPCPPCPLLQTIPFPSCPPTPALPANECAPLPTGPVHHD